MKYSYYPGCTLKTKAKDLDIYARSSAEALGVELVEVKEWQCCGGVYTTAQDEIATKLSAVRTLMSARDEGTDLVTVCAACHNVIKRVNDDMRNNEYVSTRANNYLQAEAPYAGETRVIHFLELLRDEIGFENIKKAVKNPISKKIAAYYGCLLLRPSSVMQMDNPENPSILEDFIKAIGATPVISAYRNECCGSYFAVTDKSIAKRNSSKFVDSSEKNGAEMILTACPLCLYNLKQNGGASVPVVYFTELLAEALGVK
ncbi:MAG: CoB--CoM heterodisulfide reductase iron-sulfur subunit B family protein [Clostridia bacterium]|nr:CoB--CoM heterodisulfide reductase iron-sulfur subunit B family protein [Clostridia bacterium]